MLTTIGLRTHIWNNFLRSALLLAGFPVLLAMLVFGLLLLTADTRKGAGWAFHWAVSQLPFAFALGCAVAAVWFAIAWLMNQKILDWTTGAQPVTRAEEPRLWNLLEALCISRGMAMPRLAVIDSDARNAFASGLSRELGAVTVTRGLLQALDDRELSAVLAHELTHIRNGDARLAVIAAVFAGILSLLTDGFSRGMRFRVPRASSSDSRSNSGGWLVLVGLVLVILAGVLGTALRFALSRNREYLADAGAVELTQDPDAMITALRKVSGHGEIRAIPGQVQAMMLDWPKGQSGFALWATHPAIEDRIAALVRFGGGRDPGPLPEPPAAAPPWPSAVPQLQAARPR